VNLLIIEIIGIITSVSIIGAAITTFMKNANESSITMPSESGNKKSKNIFTGMATAIATKKTLMAYIFMGCFVLDKNLNTPTSLWVTLKANAQIMG